MDRFDVMSVLLAVVEAGSFSAAARNLGKPLSTISRNVSDLETHLRTRLLLRSNRRLVLTEAGNAYVAAARRILEDVDAAERTATGEYQTPKGELVLTAPVVFGRLHLLPVTVAFLTDYPEINIRMVLADRIVDLLDDHVDVALRIGNLPDSRLKAIRLGEVRWVVCASPGYLARHGRPATPQDLHSHACISFAGVNAPGAWSFGQGRRDGPIPLRPRLVVNTAEAAIDAAAAGLGITRVLSYQIAPAQRDGRLEILLQEHEPESVPVSLVYADQGLLALKLRTFLDFAAPRLRRALSQMDE